MNTNYSKILVCCTVLGHDNKFDMKEEEFYVLEHLSIRGIHLKGDKRPWRKTVK